MGKINQAAALFGPSQDYGVLAPADGHLEPAHLGHLAPFAQVAEVAPPPRQGWLVFRRRAGSLRAVRAMPAWEMAMAWLLVPWTLLAGLLLVVLDLHPLWLTVLGPAPVLVWHLLVLPAREWLWYFRLFRAR